VDSLKSAPDLLHAVFDQLLALAGKSGHTKLPWLEYSPACQTDSGQAEGVRLVFSQLGLRRPPRLFRCLVTGHLFARTVLGCAPEDGCVSLTEVSDQDAL